MTLMCELTGLRADAYYSVENQNKNDVPIMALNQNYTIVLNLTEKILKNLEKEALIEELINFLKSLNIKVSVKNYKKKITDIYSVDTLEKLFCFIYNYK